MTESPVPTALVGAPPAAGDALEELLSAAVTSCRDVVRLSEGPFGDVATHLAGRRVPGIRLESDRVEVHVIAASGVPLPGVAEQVRAACASFTGDRPVDVTIDDIATDEPDATRPAADLRQASAAAPSIP